MFVMGRRVSDDDHSLIHQVLYLSFFVAGIAANIAIISAICSVRIRFRRRKPASSDPSKIEKDLDASTPPTTMPQAEQLNSQLTTTKIEDNEVQIKELPLPPAMQQPNTSFPSINLKKATSERRASFSLSLKLPRTLSVAIARNGDQKEDNNKGKLKEEDSVWMKTIILGEKCVPDEGDPVIYEGKGKRISAYHPRSYSSLSAQCSFLNPDELSIPQPHTQDENINKI